MDTEDLELGRQNARQGVWIGAISLNCPLNYLEGALKTAIAGASQTGGPNHNCFSALSKDNAPPHRSYH